MSKQESLFKTKVVPGKPGSGNLFDEEIVTYNGPVKCLGLEFENDAARRTHFIEELRKKLQDPEFRKIEGFPIGEDEDILKLSDPPYYTACPNPWIADFIEEWESQKPEKPADYHYHREPFAADVSEGKNEAIYNAHSYHTKVPHKAIMRYILHYTEPGDILFDGKSIYKDINTFRRIIGFCPQKPNLIKDLTVQQNLEMAGRYFGMTKCQACERMEELVAKYDLEKYRNSKMDELSGGYNHRVLIARSMVHKPKLLILDEPTVGLDPHIRKQLWETIKDLKKAGVTVVLTTHYLDEAEVLSDRICILDSGKIKLIDTPENMMKVYKKSNLEDVFLQLMNEETALK